MFNYSTENNDKERGHQVAFMSLQEGGGELLLRIISYCFPDDFFFWHPPVVNWRRMSYVFDEYMFMKRRDSVYGTSVMPFMFIIKNEAC